MKRFFVVSFSFSLVLVHGFLMLCQAQSTTKDKNQTKPNILLILSDDHSVPFLGCYGNPDLTTPNLDKLASEGVLFTNAYTTASQCVPSRASILTGRSAIDIRMSRFSAPLPRETKTIPEFLKAAGYYTGICGRPYHLDGSGKKAPQTMEAFEEYNLVTFPDRVDFLNSCADDLVSGTFNGFLENAPDDQPFFMWMNFSDPHRHFTAKEYEPNPASITLPKSMPDLPEVRKDLSQHYGEINRLDKHVGDVIDVLKGKKLYENTIILFMGDNGAALLRGKGTLYDVGLHVPLIAHWPQGIKKDSISHEMISGEDIAPTIVDLAGLPINGKITGKSFKPILVNEPYLGHDYIFAERGPHSSGLPLHTGYFDLSRTVFNKKYKLIYNALWQLPYSPIDFKNHVMWKKLQEIHENETLEAKYDKAFFSEPRSMFELFDLENDPDEFNNLADDQKYAEVLLNLKTELHKWMILNQDYLPLPIAP